jgi:hypothetical protein
VSATIAECVAAGAAFLDENDPEWWRADVANAIDLDALALESEHLCILGQRCPLELDSGYSPYAVQAVRLGAKPNDVWAWAVDLGFALHADDETPHLTAEWARVIRERRAAAVTS